MVRLSGGLSWLGHGGWWGRPARAALLAAFALRVRVGVLVALATSMLVGSLGVPPVLSHGTVDQSFEGPFTAAAVSLSPTSIGQSFTPIASALVGVDLNLFGLNACSDALTVNIREDTISGAVVTSRAQVVSGCGVVFRHVDFPTTAAVTPGALYVIEVSASGSDQFRWVAGSGYAGGEAIGHPFGGNDFGFRTYSAGTPPAAGPCAQGSTQRVSLTSSGGQSFLGAVGGSVSADGRFVAFRSVANDFVTGDTGFTDVFWRDLRTGVLKRVSVSSAGDQANEASGPSMISGDGRYVACSSLASNLVPGDTNLRDDVFVHDTQTGVTERVSVKTNGSQFFDTDASGNPLYRWNHSPTISADGSKVAFVSERLASTEIWVRDRGAGTTTKASISPSGNPITGVKTPVINGNGRFLAFVARRQSGIEDVLVRDLVNGTTEVASTAKAIPGLVGEGDAPSDLPDISPDGRYVAFRSLATNLTPEAVSGVFLRDRQAGTLELVSVDSLGRPVSDVSTTSRPAVSANGGVVAFGAGLGSAAPIWARDRTAGRTEAISVSLTGAVKPGAFPTITADGARVLFESNAIDLVSGDTNRNTDVFLRTREGLRPSTSPLAVTASVTPAPTVEGWNATNVTVDFTPSGGCADPQDTTVEVSWTGAQGGSKTGKGTVSVLILTEGTTTFSALAWNDGGQQATGSHTVRIDKTGPVATYSTDPRSITAATTSVTVSLAAGDGRGSGLAGVPVDGDGAHTEVLTVDPRVTTTVTRTYTDKVGLTRTVTVDLAPLPDLSCAGLAGPLRLPEGTQLTVPGTRPAFSGNGRLMAFEVPGNFPLVNTQVYDRVSRAVQTVNNANEPWLSWDGGYIAALNQGGQLFVHDRVAGGAGELITRTPDGAVRQGRSHSMSYDGRYVLFSSTEKDLVTGDANGGITDIFRYDRLSGRMEIVSLSATGAQGTRVKIDPVLSGDGRFVAFAASEADMRPGGSAFVQGVYLRDLAAGATELVSLRLDGKTAPAENPVISPDGRFVLFSSTDNGLVAGDTNGKLDLFLRDRQTGTTERVNVAGDGTQANDNIERPASGAGRLPAALSADGMRVAFATLASNLVPSDLPSTSGGKVDVFLRDRVAGTTVRLSQNVNGIGGDNPSRSPAMPHDGSCVAFQSLAANLVSGDTNGKIDIFLAGGGPAGPAAQADLAVAIADAPDPVIADLEQVTYTITVINNGPADATGVKVTDSLSGVSFWTPVTHVPSQGSCSGVLGGGTVCTLGTVPAGGAATVTVTVKPRAAGTLTLTATAQGFEADPNTANNSAIVTTTVNPKPPADLTVSVADQPDPVPLNGEITYTVTGSNLGPGDASGVTVFVSLQLGLEALSVTPGPGVTCPTPAQSFTCSIGSLPSGQSRTMTLLARATSTGLDGTLRASTEIRFDTATTDPDLANNKAAATTAVGDPADLSITKTDDPDPVLVTGTLTYTLRATNKGPADVTDVVVEDLLPVFGTLSGRQLMVTFLSATPSAGTCTRSGSVSELVTCRLGALAAGASGTVTILVRPKVGFETLLTNRASVRGNRWDSDVTNNSVEIATLVQPVADLHLTKTGPVSVNLGEDIAYTITVRNNGPSKVGARVLDPLPAGVRFKSGPSCVLQDGTAVCSTGTEMTVGQSRTITLVVTPAAAGTVTNTARAEGFTAAGAAVDPNSGNDSSAATTSVIGAVNQAPVFDTPPTPPAPPSLLVFVGQTMTFSVQGSDPDAGDVVTLGVSALPAGASFPIPAPGNPVSGAFTWTPTSAQVGAHAVTFTATDGAGASESRTVTIDVQPPPDTVPPATSKTVSPAPNANGWHNGDVTLAFTATDTGQAGGSASGVRQITVKVDGVTQVCPAGGSCTVVLSAEGSHTVEFYAEDNAGNREAPHTQVHRIDRTAPAVAVSRNPGPNAHGWNNTGVAVSVTLSDGGSGLGPLPDTLVVRSASTVPSPFPSGDTVPIEIVALSLTSVEPITVTFTRDPTGGYSGRLEAEGRWSILAASCDQAGNCARSQEDINIDKTVPAIAGSRTPDPNAHGWNNGDVTVSFACSDGLSGVLACSGPTTRTGEGAGQSVTGTVEDKAGNKATATVADIKIDKTAPTATFASRTPGPNPQGWNNTDVTVSFTPADALSGVDPALTTASPQTVTGEGTNLTAPVRVVDRAGNSASFAIGDPVSPMNIDKTAPTATFASRTPGPNPQGWNNTDVSVSFSTADSLSGVDVALTTASPQTVTAEGTNLTAPVRVVDRAGNAASFAIGDPVSPMNIDKTAPAIAGSRTPDPNAYGWNNSDVTVSFACSDGLSGVLACSGATTLTGEGAGQRVTGTVEDRAGNTASATVGNINIDKTKPASTATPSPTPNSAGWNNTDVSVTLVCADNLSGCAPTRTEYNLDGAGWAAYTGAIALTAEGVHTLLYRSTDRADNLEDVKSLRLRVDKTPPEAYNQFDPVGKTLLVFGRDPLSGVQPGPVSPSSVVPVKWGGGGDDGDDQDQGEGERDDERGREDKGGAELRTYRVMDQAGNVLTLVEKVKQEGHEIKARVVSLQYNGGPLITPAKNEKAYEWAAEKDGSLKELEQRLEVGTGKDRRRVEAKYEAKKNETTLRVKEPSPERKEVRAGLALLRLVTDRGRLVIEY